MPCSQASHYPKSLILRGSGNSEGLSPEPQSGPLDRSQPNVLDSSVRLPNKGDRKTLIHQSSDLPYAHVGLTRAAGVVCPGDRALMTISVLAATVEDWIIRRSRPIIECISQKGGA